MNSISRRRFLKKSCIGAAVPLFGGLIVPHSLRAAAASDRVRVGLIGCGGMGKGDLATFFLNPEVDCPVICDVDDKQLAETIKLVEDKRGKKPDTVKDFRRVIERKDVDVLLVATPDHWHALPTVLGCQAGKDVYVEKPLATSIAEGRAMLEAAHQHDRIVQMGAHRRSSPTYAEAIEFVRSGQLGNSPLRPRTFHLNSGTGRDTACACTARALSRIGTCWCTSSAFRLDFFLAADISIELKYIY